MLLSHRWFFLSKPLHNLWHRFGKSWSIPTTVVYKLKIINHGYTNSRITSNQSKTVMNCTNVIGFKISKNFHLIVIYLQFDKNIDQRRNSIHIKHYYYFHITLTNFLFLTLAYFQLLLNLINYNCKIKLQDTRIEIIFFLNIFSKV